MLNLFNIFSIFLIHSALKNNHLKAEHKLVTLISYFYIFDFYPSQHIRPGHPSFKIEYSP